MTKRELNDISVVIGNELEDLVLVVVSNLNNENEFNKLIQSAFGNGLGSINSTATTETENDIELSFQIRFEDVFTYVEDMAGYPMSPYVYVKFIEKDFLNGYENTLDGHLRKDLSQYKLNPVDWNVVISKSRKGKDDGILTNIDITVVVEK